MKSYILYCLREVIIYMKKKNQLLIVIGAFLIVLMMISSVTAVPHVHQKPTMEIINKIEKKNNFLQLIKDKLDSKHSIRFNEIINKLKIKNELNFKESYTNFESKLNRLSTASNNTTQMIIILISTIIFEFIVYVVFHSLFNKINVRSIIKLLMVCVLINVISNPVFNFIYQNYFNNLMILEAIVVVVETFAILLLFKGFSLKTTLPRAFMLSLIANIFSYLFATIPANGE